MKRGTVRKELKLTLSGWAKGRTCAIAFSRKVGLAENHLIVKLVGWVFGVVIGLFGFVVDIIHRRAYQKEPMDILHEKRLKAFTRKIEQLEKRRTEVKTDKERVKIDRHLAKLYPLLKEAERIEEYQKEYERRR